MARFTGEASPIAYSWLASRLTIASVYFSSPAKMFVLLGMPGSSPLPRMPSAPGAHAAGAGKVDNVRRKFGKKSVRIDRRPVAFAHRRPEVSESRALSEAVASE